MSSGVVLSDVIEIRKRAIDPRNHPDSKFFYYSLPAFDESGQPDVSIGAEIDSGKFRVDPGDILISKLNPRIKRVWKVDNDASFPSICSTEFVDAVPRNPEFRDFLFHLLGSDSVYRELRRVAEGTTNSHVRFRPGFLERIVVSGLPQPYSWGYIAEILSTVDEAIEQTEALIAKTERLKAGLMHDLFTRGVTPDGRLRPPREQAPGLYKESPLGWIPREWEAAESEAYCRRIKVGVVNSATHAYVQTGVPFIRSQNVRPNKIVSTDLLYVTSDFNHQQSKSILRVGDLVIVRTGYPGTTAVVPPELDGSNCFSLVIVEPAEDVIDSGYLSQYLNSPFCRREIRRLQFGSAQNNFNIGEMRRLKVPLPGMGEQGSILSRLESVDSLCSSHERHLKKLVDKKSGLTADLLKVGDQMKRIDRGPYRW